MKIRGRAARTFNSMEKELKVMTRCVTWDNNL